MTIVVIQLVLDNLQSCSKKFYSTVNMFLLIKISALLLMVSLVLTLEKKISQRPFQVKIFRLQFFNFNSSSFCLGECKITAKRGTNGLINCVAYYEGINDLWIQAKFFYRGTSGKYQPFILNLDFNACDAAIFVSGNKVLQKFLNGFDKFDPSFTKGCPLKGPFNMTNFDVDAEAAWLFPPIMPGI